MNTEKIRERIRNGFRPFANELSNGKRYLVPHPEFIIVGKTVVVVMSQNETVTTIDPLHIAALQDLPGTKAKR